MRNLVVCCDGTWNTPDQEKGGIPTPTNVVRLFNCLADTDEHDIHQHRYYHPGVGTEGNWWEKLAGGMVGVGLSRNIKSAYKWLADNWQDGDRIFLFGFSRGAYTVRSLAGMICKIGLLKLAGVPYKEAWKRVDAAYDKGYRRKRENWSKDWPLSIPPQPDDPDVPDVIHFLGVWDTVGALGIPDNMAILNLLDNRKKYAFHDTKLHNCVKHARHAVALDEKRASFAPTLWTEVDNRPGVKQIWFPGVHSDVGGGYAEIQLSNGALNWMIAEASDQGLRFRSDMASQITGSPKGVLHDSVSGIFKHLRTQPRNVPLIDPSNAAQLHTSTLSRQQHPPIEQAPYRPTERLVNAGDSVTRHVYASQRWNDTGIFLEPGNYRLTATGEWIDRHIACGPDGASDRKFHLEEIAHLAGSLWGKFEGLYRKLTNNDQADFAGTKRVEKAPWFCLIGMIANGGNPGPDGTPAEPQVCCIGKACDLAVEKPGYLYAFANDAWNIYHNNHGSVKLTVSRV